MHALFDNPYVSKSTVLYSKSNAFKASTIEEQLDDFMQYPTRLQCLESTQMIASFFTEFFQTSQNLSPSTKQRTCEWVASLPFSVTSSLLENHPLIFSEFYQCIEETRQQEKILQIFAQSLQKLDIEQRKKVLQQLTSQLEDWKDFLLGVFQSLDRNDKGEDSSDRLFADSFIKILLEALSDKRKRQWIKFCSNEIPSISFEKWAFFITTLKNPEQTLALNVSIYLLNFDLTSHGFLPWIEALALQKQCFYTVDLLLQKILHRFYRAKNFKQIANQFHQLSFPAQVCLLNAMGPSKQRQIFHQNQFDFERLALWADGLFDHCPCFLSRKKMLKNICESIRENNLDNFLYALNGIKSRVGAYLLVSLSPDKFQRFILNVPVVLRTELLLNSPSDQISWEVLHEIQSNKSRQQAICELMKLNMENPVVPIDPDADYTLKQCFELLKDISLNPDLAVDYIPFIACIPPILIGVMATIQSKRKVISNLAPYLNTEQLKFLVNTFSQLQFYTFIEKTWPLLNNGQFIALLEALSTDGFSDYVRRKIQDLQNIYSEFIEKDKKLQNNLQSIKKDKVITNKHFKGLKKQVKELHILTQRPLDTDYYYLLRFLQNLISTSSQYQTNTELQQMLIELKQIIDNLNSKCHLFQGESPLVLHQLKKIEDEKNTNEREVDLTITLYEGFWSLVREGTLPYLGISPHSSLGITHAGQLTYFGIQSNQDLEFLGISQKLQKQVESLLSDIENLQKIKITESETEEEVKKNQSKSEFENIHVLLQKCMDIKLSENDLIPICKQIIQVLNVRQLPPLQFKEKCLDFFRKLLEFQHISIKDQQEIKKGIEQLTICPEIQAAVELSCQLLEQGLIVLRSQHPLFCLQRYLLMNKNLKWVWQEFYSRGYLSIKDLIEQGVVKIPGDLLCLEDFAKQI